MVAETQLYNALSGNTDITDAVGTRIYADIRDQGSKIPSINFDRTDTRYEYTLDSYTPAYSESNFFITCYAETREEAESIADDVMVAIAGASFLCTGKESSYIDDTDDYSTTIQASLMET